jgi:hypothetical protein
MENETLSFFIFVLISKLTNLTILGKGHGNNGKKLGQHAI